MRSARFHASGEPSLGFTAWDVCSSDLSRSRTCWTTWPSSGVPAGVGPSSARALPAVQKEIAIAATAIPRILEVDDLCFAIMFTAVPPEWVMGARLEARRSARDIVPTGDRV